MFYSFPLVCVSSKILQDSILLYVIPIIISPLNTFMKATRKQKKKKNNNTSDWLLFL